MVCQGRSGHERSGVGADRIHVLEREIADPLTQIVPGSEDACSASPGSFRFMPELMHVHQSCAVGVSPAH